MTTQGRTTEGNQSIVHVAVYPTWADWALHPVEFARTALELLGALPAPVLDAWYRMFGRHEANAFAELAGQDA